MQYILTEQEYKALLKDGDLRRDAVRQTIQELCTQVAIHKPIVGVWSTDKTPSPWGCVLSAENNPGYCDDCPVRSACPYENKRFSK